MADPKSNGNGRGNNGDEEVTLEETFEHAGADVWIKTDEEGNQSVAYSSDVDKATGADSDNDANGNGNGNGDGDTDNNNHRP